VLYYFRERSKAKNFELRYLIITNINEWFVFDAQDFEKLFYQNKTLLKHFKQFENKTLSGTSTDFFYKDIASPEIEKIKLDIPYSYFDIRDYNKILRNKDKEDDKKLIALYKFLSPTHLLKLSFTNDYNQLNKEFYAELLHILGLEEIKEKSQKFIVRKSKEKRDNGSIIENAINELDSMDKLSRLPNISQYGSTYEERLFNVALDLSITWINRVLFLKLLEAQIIKYHNGDKKYSFLLTEKIEGYDDLNSLFFQILARKEEERREGYLKDKFTHVPYLNSSLFEQTELEAYTLVISNLRDKARINLYSKSVLKSKDIEVKELNPLDYLLKFLDAYDFSSEGSEDIQEENKALISASVLGLIFEKINGYKDGSFFTPSFITMFMCRDTITRTVLQKFNEIKGWECKTIIDLHNKISDIQEANQIFNSIRLCDPAVGSGHFLVSCLNEMIYLKSELGILVDKEGKRLKDYRISIENDELIISDNAFGIYKYNPHNHESQRVQETLFHEKQTIIENCLFGVDINPNSVKICQLRLWIELLKHTYYIPKTNHLETLPNIDINIKCGNSLVSRFSLNEDLKPILRGLSISISEYKDAVSEYRNAHNKEDKRRLEQFIQEIKTNLKTEISRNDKNSKNLLKAQKELSSLTAPSLFELTPREQKALQKKIADTQKAVNKYKTIIDEIKNNRIYQNAFEWRIEFPEVLNDEGVFIGFDAIIGNPPYMRIQGIRDNDPNLADKYNNTYTSATGSYDLYALFTEKSLDLVKGNALINFIMPVKWTNATFGKGLRTVISSSNAISKIINFGSFMVFDASTYTGLQWFKKGSEILEYVEINDNITTSIELTNYLDKITESSFNKISSSNLSEDQWTLSDRQIMSILDKLNRQPRRISDVFDKIFQGLATSKDDVYFLYDCESDNEYVTGYSKHLSETVRIERGLIKPLLKGEDVHRYEPVKSNRFVIFPYKKEDSSSVLYTEEELELNFPLGYKYLKRCEPTLRGREKGRFNIDGEWFQYGRKQGINYAECEKLVAPEISKGGNFSYDFKGEFYSTTTIYGYIKRSDVPESYKCLMGILNSNLFWWYLINTGTVLANAYFRFKPDYIKPFPIPAFIPKEIEHNIVYYVDKIVESKCNNFEQSTLDNENKIDDIVFSLYELTEDEIKLIKDSIR
ncbi:MAG: TaqI-like C-terminal specificity domain-containing protein, partial [Dysgonomonas sp.]|nr:TaqI-like C-terminal specificity domain-containing protein [Dysgonomonas sp.]